MIAADVRTPPASIGTELCFARWSEDQKSNVIQTEQEDGSIMVRRRFTGKWRMIEISVNYDANKYTDFVTFFDTTLKQGIDATWVKTPYGKIEAWRFASTPGISWSSGAEVFYVTATMVRNDAWPVK